MFSLHNESVVIGKALSLPGRLSYDTAFSPACYLSQQVLGMTLLHMPQTINMILPLIMILATVVLFLSLARSSELVVTRAAGRSALSALQAPIWVAFIIGVMAVGMLNPIVAATAKKYGQMTDSIRAGGTSVLSVSARKARRLPGG